MRSSMTTLDTGRSRVRTGIAPSTNIRVQRATESNGRSKPSNSNSSKSNSNTNSSNTGISHRRITQFSSTEIPSIPPRTRQTNGGRINLSHSQGIHTNINTNTGVSQTRNQQRPLNQTLTRTPQISQTQSRTVNSINNGTANNNSSQTQRTQNRTRVNTTTNNSATTRTTEEGRLFPRAPPPAEAARRNLHRNTRNSENTTSSNRLNINTNTQQNNNSHSTTEENSTHIPNFTRPQIQSRTIAPPRTPPIQHQRTTPSVPPGDPIIPVPNTRHNSNESQNRSLNHQPSPSDNVGSKREPQVLIRSSANSISNRTTNTNSTSIQPQPSNSPNPHLTLNFNVQSSTLNTRNSNNGNLPNNNQNTNQPQIRTPNANTQQQQHNARPILINTGTRTTPNTNQNPNPTPTPNRNRNSQELTTEDDEHLGLFDELFSILDNFPINVIPLIPVMFDTTFGPFLERVIPLYLAHYERNQIMRAIDESMREAENPRPSPPKEVKLIKHMVDKEDISNERQCLVCLNDFVAGEQTVMLKCGHFFHKDCLMPWLAQHHTCPTCRENIDETLIGLD